MQLIKSRQRHVHLDAASGLIEAQCLGRTAGGSVITASPLVAQGWKGRSYGRSRPGRDTQEVFMALAPLCGGARLRIRP
jgi:hypothetical protein